jgi:hypothetical protein
MKRLGWLFVILMAASPAWAVKNLTAQQLKDLLVADQQAKKADADVASDLKQVVLTEELTRTMMNSLIEYVPGPYSTEQIYVLEARSAILAPPAADLPTTPAPDAAAQKALLDKAADYATKTYALLPALTATKTTIRFQDNMEATAASSGMHSGATDSASSDPNLVAASQFVHYINSTESSVEIKNGVEENPLAKDKTQWGANKMIALLGNGPALGNVIQEAQTTGKINFLRWETVNGKAAAVFAFSVDKKKTHYAVNYCCFPDSDQAGVMNYSMPKAGGGGAPSSLNANAKGNLQTVTSWKNYKATIPYHGELFVDPDTGIVVRLVTQAEFKNTDVVHQEDQRIDFAPVPVGGKTLVLPVKTVVNTEVVPNGDSQATGKYSTRHTLFTSEYKGYQASS